ncbi:hypothetical protein [Amnibacterium kyonggiense]|uniref:hypothetical protein n=1 Tax=Amnibacterium kyonggiense TaxID=595671 RepID=UPI0031DE144B
MIATTAPGKWFGCIDSTGTIAVVTENGIEPVSYPERLALREILMGTVDDDA